MRSIAGFSFLLLAGCGSGSLDTGDTGGDTADTGDSADTADTGPDLVQECATDPCGGEAAGTWTLVQTCFDDSTSPLGDCEGTTIRLVDFQLDATLTLNADGSFENIVSGGTFDTEISVPSACNDVMSCPDVEDQLPTGYVCSDDGVGGCTCLSTSAWTPSEDTGVWSVTGTTLTLGEDDAPYCADGDELWVDLSGAGFIPLQMVYSKQ